jgi:hypothetical protein
MACTACLVCLISTVIDCRKNALGRASASSEHITKLEQSTFLSISIGSTNKTFVKFTAIIQSNYT